MPEPRRALRPVAAWLAAAVAAVAVASWGVALVGRSVTDSRPAPLSAAQVEERLESASAPASTGAGTEAPVSGTTPSTAPGAAGPGATTPGPAAPGTDPPGASAPPATTSPPAAPPATTPPTAVAPPASAVPAPVGETRTYQLVGGTVSLRFEPTGVVVVFANPAQGFEVEQEPEHGNGVRVEFESETHRSRVTGWWEGGPQDRVDEQSDGD